MKPDEDLASCLSKQPRKKPKPKREVTSLTFSPQRWRRSQGRVAASRNSKHWLVWGGGAVVGLFVLFNLPLQNTATLSTSGPVSENNLANFPPPHPVGEIVSDGQSFVTVINAVPGKMRLRLVGSEHEWAYDVEPCRSCAHTNDSELLQKFCDRAPQTSFYVPPGQYEVFVSYGSRVASYRSQWDLSASWSYEQCVGGRLNWN